MAMLIQEANINNENKSDIELFLDIAWPEFVSNNGCVLNSKELGKSHFESGTFEDETSLEAFVNHIHVKGDNLGDGLKPFEVIRACMKIVKMWKIKLLRDFPKDNFLIIFSFDEEESEATIRFHKIRESQIPWLDVDGIEGYLEPVMAVMVNGECDGLEDGSSTDGI
jgi:hypothetical protein